MNHHQIVNKLLKAMVVALAVVVGATSRAATIDGALRVEVVTAYNLVVDSNAGTPSSYAPRSAYLGVTFHNDGTVPLTDVIARIGDYQGPGGDTPGIYPARAHVGLTGPLQPGNMFALTHEGGSAGLSDATRYIASLPAGDSITIYWLIGYPQLDVNGIPTWGKSVKPDDDLWLQYDVWATAKEGAATRAVDTTRTVTFRNEISASANKIFPNGANKVPDYYKALLAQYVPAWTNVNADGSVGTRIITEGIWYDLGNVGAGFDNNGDLVPDHNAWMQPVGDPSLFDSGAFRLVHTYAMVVVKLVTGGEVVLTGEDQLYFENIPENNGAVGYVRYDFLPLKPGATSYTTPYQEVASGRDNEKFNADYGVSIGGALYSGEARVLIDKTADKTTVVLGSSIAYQVSYTNAGTVAVGDAAAGLPLVIQDTVPVGTVYVAGSAASGNVPPTGVSGYTVFYSTDDGATWTQTEPPAADVTDLQWWLSDQLDAGLAGRVGFAVDVPGSYTAPQVENCAGLSYGDTDSFATDCVTTLVLGDNSLSGTVFEDDGTGANFANGVLNSGDASEVGIPSVLVSLYADINGNGVVDIGDLSLATTNSAANGTYAFTALPDGRYVVVVSPLDPDVPAYYSLTTPSSRPATLDPLHASGTGVSVTGLNFGFAPPLSLDKSGGATVYEGQLVTYRLTVRNHLYSTGAISTTNLYWAPRGQVNRAPLTLATNIVVSSNTGVTNGGWGVYVDRSRNRIYWADQVTDTIWQDDLDAATAGSATALLTGLDNPAYMAIDHKAPGGKQYLWWSGNGTLQRTDLGASPLVVEGRFATDVTQAAGIAIDEVNRWVYFLARATGSPAKYWIYRQSLDGAANSRDTSWGVEIGSSGAMYDLELEQATQRLYFVNPNIGYKFYTIAIATQTLTLQFDLSNGSDIRGVALNAPAGIVYFSFNTAGQIVSQQLSGGAVITTLADGTTPGDVDIEYGAGAGTYDVNTTVGLLTLKDEYPADKIEYVSASVLPDSTTPLGTLTWNNLGPLNGGDSTWVDVTFRALAQAGNTVVSLLNTGKVSYAEFENGKEANRPEDTQPTQILPSGSIAGRVWADTDGDGWQPLTGTPSYGYEAGEAGIGAVTVYLDIDANNDGTTDSVVTNRTNATGDYFFGSLATNVRYRVRVDAATLPGTAITATGDPDDDVLNAGNGGTGSANSTWSNAAAGWFRIGVDSRRDASGTAQSWNVTNVNFGYTGTDPVIYGLVWLDLDRDGVRDANEPGLSGASLTLSGAASNTVVTAADGTYRFLLTGAGAFLPTGTYTNTLTPPSGPTWTYTFESPTNTFGVANALLPYDGKLSFPVASTSETSGSWDIGLIFDGAYSVGDTVYFDLNANGRQDAGEAGIANVDMRLYYDSNGNGALDATDFLWASQTTGADGQYLFQNLANGRYFVVVDETDIPSGYRQTADPDQPGMVAFNGDGMGVATLNNANLLTVDFGYAPQGTGVIGDLVYRDLNGNGSYQSGETGISNVTVRLYYDRDGNGSYETLVATDTTGTSGDYLFEHLPDGAYRVEVLTSDPDLNGLVATTVTAYTLTLSNGVTSLFNGVATVTDRSRDADFGFAARPSIGDFVYYDANRNGTQDYGEVGIPGVTVYLYSDPNGDGNPGDGTRLATTVTATGSGAAPVGSYLFPDLTPNAYYLVRVETNSLPLFNGVPIEQTADPDRDGVPCWDDTAYPGLPPGDHQDERILLSYAPYVGADFGYLPPGVIGDLLWIDVNTNGVFDAGEQGIPYVTVALYDATGTTLIATNVTDPDGYYIFGNLTNGTYRVEVVTTDPDFPAALLATYDPDGTPDGVANGIVVSGGHVTSIGGTPVTDADLDIDFGYRYAGSNTLSGTVGMDDPLKDGLMNGYNPSGPGAGEYAFAGRTVYLYLWNDGTNNVPDAGETTLIASTTTDANGDYAFVGLPAGDGTNRYIVALSAPAGGLKLTTETGDNTEVLWVSSTTNYAGIVQSAYQVVAIQPTRTNIDFAFETSTLRDYGDLPVSYSTTVGDLPQGPSHSVLPGVDLWLGSEVTTEANGIPTIDASGDSEEDGAVAFGRWREGSGGGTVVVTVGAGSGWLVGWVDFNQDGTFTNANEQVISRAVSSTENGGVYPLSFNIPAGTFATDAGTVLNSRFRLYRDKPFLALATGSAEGGDIEDHQFAFGLIGNRVWDDSLGIANNGIQDAGETGLVGVAVTLYERVDQGGGVFATNEVGSAVTDADGMYFIPGLPSGDYILRVSPPSGYALSRRNAGLDPEADSDFVQATTYTAPITLDSGGATLAYDAGFYYAPTLAVIMSFRAFGRDGTTAVQWEVAEEFDTLYYWLERMENGVWQRINPDAPAWSLSGEVPWGPYLYEVADPGAAAGGTYTWRIVEVENSGRENVYGPYTVTVDGAAADFDAWAAGVAWDGAAAGRDDDPDGDGLTNFEEFLAGTDPLSAESVLRITALRAVPDGLEIRWPSAAGRVYAVEYARDLGGNWLPVSPNEAATPDENRFVLPGTDRGFFRVVLKAAE